MPVCLIKYITLYLEMIPHVGRVGGVAHIHEFFRQNPTSHVGNLWDFQIVKWHKFTYKVILLPIYSVDMTIFRLHNQNSSNNGWLFRNFTIILFKKPKNLWFLIKYDPKSHASSENPTRFLDLVEKKSHEKSQNLLKSHPTRWDFSSPRVGHPHVGLSLHLALTLFDTTCGFFNQTRREQEMG